MWHMLYHNDEFMNKLKLLAERYRINEAGKMEPPMRGGDSKSPWIFINKAPFRCCRLWHEVYFNHFKIIPKFCREKCWKVVVKPGTCREAIMLLDMMRAFNLPSKIGLEKRDYVKGRYSAFFYTESKEHGLEVYKLVRNAVDTHIGEHIPVSLKQGCTEMEMKIPVAEWCPEKCDPDNIEPRLDTVFELHADQFPQPQWKINDIKLEFCKVAWKHGDDSYREVCGDLPIDSEVKVTYHHEADSDSNFNDF